MMAQYTKAQIAESRRAKGVPAHWEWRYCAARCGDIVWVPPDVIASHGGIVKAVCSANCAFNLTLEKPSE